MEVRLALFQEQLAQLNPDPITVDLTQEEGEGGVKGPIFLAPAAPSASKPAKSVRIPDEALAGIECLMVNLMWFEELGEEMINGEYTPTGPSPWGVKF